MGMKKAKHRDFVKQKKGFSKIIGCCGCAKEQGYDWVWDTCCTIQTHHRRQCPTTRVAHAADNGGRMYIAFQYKRINNISILHVTRIRHPVVVAEQPLEPT